MRTVKRLTDQIMDELCSARSYAEKAIELRVKDDDMYTKYIEMAKDEIKHSEILHAQAISEIENLKRYYTPPVDMIKMWEEKHQKYIEKSAYIKSLITL